jgi:nucleoside 2-deoxyribosyltransferase
MLESLSCDDEEPRRSRGFYRYLDASSDGVRSYSLCGTESVNSLVGDGSSIEQQSKKVFFLGFPGPLDEEFGLEAMETLKTDLCARLGLEAVFFFQKEDCVPRILKDRAQEILTRRLIHTVQSCDAACLDVSPRPAEEEVQLAWRLGVCSGCWKPVVGYGERADPAAGAEGASRRCWASLVEEKTFSSAALDPGERRARYVAALEEALLCLKKNIFFSP